MLSVFSVINVFLRRNLRKIIFDESSLVYLSQFYGNNIFFLLYFRDMLEIIIKLTERIAGEITTCNCSNVHCLINRGLY
jgi:hypothetical protein